MSPQKHLVAGILLGTCVYGLTKDIAAGTLCLIGAVCPDVDHLLEYGVYCIKNKVKPGMKEFISGKYFAKKGTIVLFFHGYEYALGMLLVIAELVMNTNGIDILLAAFTFGYIVHIIMDLLGNDFGIKGYSIIYRATRKFNETDLCVKNRLK